jgi:glycerophosphoryl diester phosphodiesterase
MSSKQDHKILCIGHRGAMGYAPENTLLSISKAIELGADWIEVDVYWVEGELIVIHDPFLERTTNGEGAVMEQSLEMLRSLDAGEGEKIPFLYEVFDLVDRRAGINIELKGPETAVSTVNFIQSQIKKGWEYDNILVSSFDHNMLRTVRQLDARIKIGALIYQKPNDLAQIVTSMNAFSINPWLMTMTEPFVRQAQALGLHVYVYTVNEPDDIERMRQWGVDGIFTDFPDRV